MPQRKVGKRKRLKPLMLSGRGGLLRVVVHLESVFVHLHSPVTRASYFRRRCARRSVLLKTTRYVLALTPHHRTVARHCTATAAIVIGTATATATAVVTGTVIAVPRHIILSGGSRVNAGARRRGEADGSHYLNRSRWFPKQTRPRRT